MNLSHSYARYEKSEGHELQVLGMFLGNSNSSSRSECHSGGPLPSGITAHTAQENFGEFLRGLLLVKLDEVHLGKVEAGSMVINRADEGLHRNVRITTIESPLTLPLLNVITQEPEERANLPLAIFLGEFVAFQRRVKL